MSGLPKGLGEGEKRKAGLTQILSENRVTHPKSGCGTDWIIHNTSDVISLTGSKYEQSDRQEEAILIFDGHLDVHGILLWIERNLKRL